MKHNKGNEQGRFAEKRNYRIVKIYTCYVNETKRACRNHFKFEVQN